MATSGRIDVNVGTRLVQALGAGHLGKGICDLGHLGKLLAGQKPENEEQKGKTNKFLCSLCYCRALSTQV